MNLNVNFNDYVLVKQTKFGPLLLKMLKNDKDDYIIAYFNGVRAIEIYEHEHYNKAETDWNTLYHGFRAMLAALKLPLE